MKNIIYYNAGAGSGKTYKLTHLLSDLLSKGTYKPSEVILTTFSELAAGEFRQRSFECLYSEGKTEIASIIIKHLQMLFRNMFSQRLADIYLKIIFTDYLQIW